MAAPQGARAQVHLQRLTCADQLTTTNVPPEETALKRRTALRAKGHVNLCVHHTAAHRRSEPHFTQVVRIHRNAPSFTESSGKVDSQDSCSCSGGIRVFAAVAAVGCMLCVCVSMSTFAFSAAVACAVSKLASNIACS